MFLLILLIVCLVCSCCGFKKFVYFLSVGYGLAVAGAGLTMLIYYSTELTDVNLALEFLLIIYGLRLAGFLIYREMKSASYRKTLTSATKTEKPMPMFVKVSIWVCVSILYVFQVSPIAFRLMNYTLNSTTFAYLGIVIMIIGIILETLADKQKNDAKKINASRYVDTGLYKFVRCPNYLGEVTFWTGVLISGIGAVSGLQWIIAIFGYVCIVYIMLSGAKRLEVRQSKRYGEDAEFMEYCDKTPILIPFVPLYHLKDVDWIK